jgi:hypothetical protein
VKPHEATAAALLNVPACLLLANLLGTCPIWIPLSIVASAAILFLLLVVCVFARKWLYDPFQNFWDAAPDLVAVVWHM